MYSRQPFAILQCLRKFHHLRLSWTKQLTFSIWPAAGVQGEEQAARKLQLKVFFQTKELMASWQAGDMWNCREHGRGMEYWCTQDQQLVSIQLLLVSVHTPAGVQRLHDPGPPPRSHSLQ